MSSHVVRPAAFSLGANQGRPLSTLLHAVECLEARLGPLRVSPFYRTAPISQISQPDYLNLAVLVFTDRSPSELLSLAQELEGEAGRLRPASSIPGLGAPRTLDIDLLTVGEEILLGPHLTLPHPRLRQRRFVLAPLADIAPELQIPPDGKSVRQLLANLDQREDRGGAVERLPPPEPI